LGWLGSSWLGAVGSGAIFVVSLGIPDRLVLRFGGFGNGWAGSGIGRSSKQRLQVPRCALGLYILEPLTICVPPAIQGDVVDVGHAGGRAVRPVTGSRIPPVFVQNDSLKNTSSGLIPCWRLIRPGHTNSPLRNNRLSRLGLGRCRSRNARSQSGPPGVSAIDKYTSKWPEEEWNSTPETLSGRARLCKTGSNFQHFGPPSPSLKCLVVLWHAAPKNRLKAQPIHFRCSSNRLRQRPMGVTLRAHRESQTLKIKIEWRDDFRR